MHVKLTVINIEYCNYCLASVAAMAMLCPRIRCRYLGFSHNAIGPPHLTAFVSFLHFSYLENIHKE